MNSIKSDRMNSCRFPDHPSFLTRDGLVHPLSETLHKNPDWRPIVPNYNKVDQSDVCQPLSRVLADRRDAHRPTRPGRAPRPRRGHFRLKRLQTSGRTGTP